MATRWRGYASATGFAFLLLLFAGAIAEDTAQNTESASRQEDPCEGRRVRILNLGDHFHQGLLYGAEEHDPHDARRVSQNGGFGPVLAPGRRDAGKLLQLYSENRDGSGEEKRRRRLDAEGSSGAGVSGGRNVTASAEWPELKSTWFNTYLYVQDILFHSRLKKYPCLVKDEGTEADLYYVAYYGSFDLTRTGGKDGMHRSQLGRELAMKLSQERSFQNKGGRAHVVAIGRTVWDVTADVTSSVPWGSDVMKLETMKRVQLVAGERGWWMHSVVSAPYPTSFHPPGLTELRQWQKFVSSQPRPWLFAFAGARRRNADGSFNRAGAWRETVFWQCAESSSCRVLNCENPPRACDKDWRIFTQLYLSASFCIHPSGDACTRRAVFDSMIAGCIPVLLEPCTVKWQYEWLMGPADEFSITVNASHLKGPPGVQEHVHGEVMLEKVLGDLPPAKVEGMRHKILELMPRFTWGGRSHGPGTISPPDFKDAFDFTLEYLIRKAKGEAVQ